MTAIRKVEKYDLHFLKEVIDTSGLFPSEMLEEMMQDYFSNDQSRDIWLTAIIDAIPVAISYCAPEKLTDGTYNLYLIAVHESYRGKGIGHEMISHVEHLLQRAGERILLVETSGLPEFELTRKFYDKCNYEREAVIRDFYCEGEDKIVFRKKLQ